MSRSEFKCDCCREDHAATSLGGYIGIGETEVLCISCFRLYLDLKVSFPDKTVVELLDTVKTLYALERLSEIQKSQMKRLIFMFNNDSKRAQRLVAMALDGQISVVQLLSII